MHHFAGLRRKQDEARHFSGISTCGSGWVCPVCAPKIRYHRTDEVSRAVVAALQQGMGVLFVTQTIPHSAEDALGVTLGLLAEGRRYVSNQWTVKEAHKNAGYDAHKDAGYVGSITAKEITYGYNGWHPHCHQLEFFERELSLEDFATLSSAYYTYLSRFYQHHGFDGLSRQHGVVVKQAQIDAPVLARYVAKLQESSALGLHTAHELTRSDLKHGRAGSLMPFDIACGYFETGDMTLLDLWHEYERDSKGKSAIRFTKGLRARLLPLEPELTDKQSAERQVGGVDVVRFDRWYYYQIARVPGLEGKVLTALDRGGFAALVELLTVYHLDDQSWYWQIKSEAIDEAQESM